MNECIYCQVFCALFTSGGAAGLGLVVDNQRLRGKHFDHGLRKFYTLFDASCGLLLASAVCTVVIIMVSVFRSSEGWRGYDDPPVSMNNFPIQHDDRFVLFVFGPMYGSSIYSPWINKMGCDCFKNSYIDIIIYLSCQTSSGCFVVSWIRPVSVEVSWAQLFRLKTR